MDDTTFQPGMLVKVIKGTFAGRTGVVLASQQSVDPRGERYPPTLPGYYWVMLDDNPCAVHMYQDQIEPAGPGG
jgi:hypothetical protein